MYITVCSSISQITYRLLATGDNRLLVAAMINDTPTITSLITEEGVSVNAEFFHNGYTALHQGTQEGHVDSVVLLLELGADCNKKVICMCQYSIIYCSCFRVDYIYRRLYMLLVNVIMLKWLEYYWNMERK